MWKKLIPVTLCMSLCVSSWSTAAGEEIQQVLKQQTTVEPPQAPSLNPQCISGVFILCERGVGGRPEARLFTAINRVVKVRALPTCQRSGIQGRKPGKTKLNHALLWPWLGEDFTPLQYYREDKWACFNGNVQVQRGNAVLYSCLRPFEAHTVTFRMC